jgi:hypothetical protein
VSAGASRWLARLLRRPLSARERARLVRALAAVLPGERAGLPAFGSLDHAAFFAAIEHTTGPTFLPGLRAMLLVLEVLPLAKRSFRKRFSALDADARVAFCAALADDEGYLARQLTGTLKVLAGLAYFDAPAVRARFDTTPLGAP